MGKFENELFHTVDNILLLLGHKPSFRTKQEQDVADINQPEAEVKDQSAVKVRVPLLSKKGARLVKSPSELSRLLDKM